MTRTSVGARLRARFSQRLRAVTVTAAISAGLLATSAIVATPSASAATHLSWNQKVSRVIHVARAEKGKPYRYGAAGPRSFDCSGLVQFVYRRALGERLPRTAAAQYHASKHIGRHQLRIGDLVFVKEGGYISHVGIYAGHGYWWVAPHTGTVVNLQKIYTSHVVYGRVIR